VSSFDVTVTSAPPMAHLTDDSVMEVVVPVVLPLGDGGTHLGTFRFLLDEQSAKKFFAEGLKLAEDMKPQSPITVASDLSQVEKTAEKMAKLTND
jgi:hypothetical protein